MTNKITARKNRVIKGQPHKLAYINDAEEGLLMSLGGTGEMVDGIPAFVPGFGKEASDGAARDAERDAMREGPSGDGPNKFGISGGQAQAMFGDATMAGMVTANDVDKILNNSKQADKTGTLPELQKRAQTAQQMQDLFMGNALMKAIGLGSKKTAYDSLADLIGMKGSYVNEAGKLFAPTGGSTMFGPSGLTQGLFGQVTYTGMPNPDYTGPFANLVNPYKDPNADGPEVVPAQENPLTGEGVCPDGYIFDDQLQACRLDTGSTAGDTGFGGDVNMDERYYRPTALDQPSVFQPTDFDFGAANKAFVDSFAYNPANYEKQMNLTGFVPTSGLLT